MPNYGEETVKIEMEKFEIQFMKDALRHRMFLQLERAEEHLKAKQLDSVAFHLTDLYLSLSAHTTLDCALDDMPGTLVTSREGEKQGSTLEPGANA